MTFLVGKRKVINCKDCADDSGLKKTTISKEELRKMFVAGTKTAYCSNCEKPIKL